MLLHLETMSRDSAPDVDAYYAGVAFALSALAVSQQMQSLLRWSDPLT